MTAHVTAAPKREFVAEAYESLRRLIVQGHLGPGTRLVEAELAARLGMSRTPLRTALYLLNQEGYVEATGEGRQSRLTVTPLTQVAAPTSQVLLSVCHWGLPTTKLPLVSTATPLLPT